jgi:Ras-related protein Rab-18
VPTADGAAFADRQGALFLEASAKTAVGVSDAFREVVERILETSSLWDDAPTARLARRGGANDTMPGNITLDDHAAGDGGCAC